MRILHRASIIPLLALSLLFFASCSFGDQGSDATSGANDEAAASMASGEGGADDVIAASMSYLDTSGARSLTYTSGATTPTVTFLDDSGATVPAASATKATLSWTRTASFTSTRASGTTDATANLTFSGLGTATWSVSGTIELVRTTTVTRTGRTAQATITHDLDLTLNPPATSATYHIAGGTATTTGSFSINDGATFTRGYTWTFNGDGSATLKTDSGTVVDVSVTVE